MERLRNGGVPRDPVFLMPATDLYTVYIEVLQLVARGFGLHGPHRDPIGCSPLLH